MPVKKIVHLSDLHFAPNSKSRKNKDIDIWLLVSNFINNLYADAILITGDLTDNATPQEYQLAYNELARLRVGPNGDRHPYRVVPGNHDRFIMKGNSVPFLKGRREKDKQTRFDGAFTGGRQITRSAPEDIPLAGNAIGPGWDIRLIGLDSCEDQNWFAQGGVSTQQISQVCGHAMAKPESDLVIALVHHHVLPIPQLENERARSGLAAVADVTGFLNSGCLLNGLSRSHVNLVLHGHEHYAYQARFRAIGESTSEVVVVSAGSATGEETCEGWSLDRVQFNVIELREDRSVWLREVRYENPGLGFHGDPRLLHTPADIRRSCFLRRNRPQINDAGESRGAPKSRLRTNFELTIDRDVQLTTVHTEWVVLDTWTPTTTSTSGFVGSALATFNWPSGETDRVIAEFIRDDFDSGLYRLAIPLLENQRGRKADAVTTNWTWAGGAVLTRVEWDSLPPEARGGMRSDAKEYVAAIVGPKEEFEALRMTVRLPPRFAPDAANVNVYRAREGESIYRAAEDLRRNLEFCGDSVIELQIPYPIPGHTYFIAWTLPNIDCLSDEAQLFLGAAENHGELLVETARQALAPLMDVVGLYILRNGSHLRRVAGTGPDGLNFRSASSPLRAAWWRRKGILLFPDDEQDDAFSPGEQAVAYVPVHSRQDEELCNMALGLLRIARTTVLGKINEENDRIVDAAISAGQAVLQRARKTYGDEDNEIYN